MPDGATDDVPGIIVVLVGVSAPDAFTYAGKDYAFHTAQGVGGDLDFYQRFLEHQTPTEERRLLRLDGREETRVGPLKATLLEAAGRLPAHGLFVLVLCGHGFQARDLNGDEPDQLDEVFAASDGPLLDDFFADLWSRLPPTADVVIIADTCSSDSIGLAGGPSIEPVISIRAGGPYRLSISASMPWETAGEVTTRRGVRGVLSQKLEDIWDCMPESHDSYLKWFLAAAENVSVTRPRQHPRLRYVAPDDGLLNARPLQLRS